MGWGLQHACSNLPGPSKLSPPKRASPRSLGAQLASPLVVLPLTVVKNILYKRFRKSSRVHIFCFQLLLGSCCRSSTLPFPQSSFSLTPAHKSTHSARALWVWKPGSGCGGKVHCPQLQTSLGGPLAPHCARLPGAVAPCS